MPTPHDPGRSRSGTVIAGRYTLGEAIGIGGASTVYEAVDDVTGGRVAVKLLHPGGVHIGDRARREIAALRLLRLPGVVTLQDEGTFEDAPFLVMEFVEGAAFPGRPTPVAWPELAAPTLSMLETLARVHAVGVVHRDLKPSNVFVGDDLNVTILDFGLAWGPALGEALTQVGGIVGTMEYVAPEQLAGVRGDPRSDLYALGIMLYEALTGTLPHQAKTLGDLAYQKLHVTPRPIRQIAPDTPRRVAQTVERLLSRETADRPESVGDVLHQLYDREVTALLASVLPRLGDVDLPSRIAERLQRGESVDVTGPLGTGRSRVLTDATELLAAAGRTPRWASPGTAPFSSALALFGDLPGLEMLDPPLLEERLGREIEGALADGVVFLVDEPTQIDEWSMRVFDRAHASGGFLRVVLEPTPGCIELSRLTEHDLRPLFAGPDRIFHLREDGAAELFGRTGGLPSRVANEIGAWVRAGLAHWHEGRLVIARDALQQLAGGLPVITAPASEGGDERDAPGLQDLMAWITLAWPHTSEDVLARATKRPPWRLKPELDALAGRHRITRLDDGRYQPVASSAALRVWPAERLRDAHRSLADVLPPGTPDRLRHLSVAGSDAEVIGESIQRSDSLCTAGRYVDARVAAEVGLVAARRTADTSGEHSLLRSIAHICLGDGSRAAIQQGLYDLGRAMDRDESIEQIERLMVIARDAQSTPPVELLDALEKLGPFDDVTFELWRRSQQFKVSMRVGREREAATIAAIEEWAQSTNDPSVGPSVESWRLLNEFHAGHPLEAARAQEKAAATERTTTMRLMSLMNAGLAYSEAGDVDGAERLGRLVRNDASARRAASFEAEAEVLLRFVEYQRELTVAPDPELVDAIAMLGNTVLDARTAMTEAAVAWRAGDLQMGRDLARRTTELCRIYDEPDCDALPRALELVCGADATENEVEALAHIAMASEDADTAVQTLGLLAIVCPERAGEFHAQAAIRAKELEYLDARTRRIVLSVAEATGQGLPDQSMSTG